MTDSTVTATRPAPEGGGRIFYGWVVVAAAFTVLFIGYGLQFSFGVFVPAIVEDTGWSRAQLSLPYAIYVALYSALSSFSGRLTDRHGPRVVIAGGAVALTVGWASFALARELWQVYVAFGLVAGIGMSAAWVPSNATVVRWFTRRRGLAVGVASSGGSAGNLIAPPLVTVAIAALGWRTALVIAAVVGGVGLLVASRFMVRQPELRGLFPDGDPEPPPPPDGHPAAAETAFTLAQARRTATFWLLFGVFASTWLVVFVPFVHLAAFAGDQGLSALGASLAVSAIGLGGVVGRLGVGWASDRVGRRFALGMMLALQVLSFVGFAAATTTVVIHLAAVVFGFSYGGAVTLFPALVGDAFGRAHAGAIVGTLFAVAGSLAAIGPFVAGALYDLLGSYRLAFLLSGLANLIGLALLTVLRPPTMVGTGGDSLASTDPAVPSSVRGASSWFPQSTS